MDSAQNSNPLTTGADEPDRLFDPNRADANFVRLLLAESTRNITRPTAPHPSNQLFLELEDPNAA